MKNLIGLLALFAIVAFLLTACHLTVKSHHTIEEETTKCKH